MSLQGNAKTPPPMLPQIPNSMIGTSQVQGQYGTTGQRYDAQGNPIGSQNNGLFQSQINPQNNNNKNGNQNSSLLSTILDLYKNGNNPNVKSNQ